MGPPAGSRRAARLGAPDAWPGAFRLSYVPKAAGLAVYELVARRGGQILTSEPVPVEVVPTRALRVLLLANTPSFEFKFLKNQLGTRQHAVALRVGISRGLTQTEFLNQPTHDISRLTPSLLAHYDAVIADAGTLSTLSGGEVQQLTTALRTGGPGLIVLADAAPLPRLTPARATFSIVPVAMAASAKPQPIQWPGLRAAPLLQYRLPCGHRPACAPWLPRARGRPW
ncbi:hypothetical protein H9L05_08135 [Hymenobacter qilianensis]|uniref:Uncharacterized protein n=1 Tax=Hymenobacter qilianensis TaxID=1385715 RepID=A0A7H0GZ04_9BACT|nr:hypothetical protein [Hymenobacter qilianensis]QNP53520.1 hypothetical protein H9L05_08135 [Hymenobacter qilianensis]